MGAKVSGDRTHDPAPGDQDPASRLLLVAQAPAAGALGNLPHQFHDADTATPCGADEHCDQVWPEETDETVAENRTHAPPAR